MAAMLVKLLVGAFDPPPDALAQPLGYLVLVLAAAALALWIATRQRRPAGLEARLP